MASTAALPDIEWDIRPEGRQPSLDELRQRIAGFPERTDFVGDTLEWGDLASKTLLGTLLELVGTRAAVQLGDPEAWRTAVADLP